jgi:hypothetical protein
MNLFSYLLKKLLVLFVSQRQFATTESFRQIRSVQWSKNFLADERFKRNAKRESLVRYCIKWTQNN